MFYAFARIDWNSGELKTKIEKTLESRVRIAAMLLKKKVQKNISKLVVKDGSRVIRSLPGEFPRKDIPETSVHPGLLHDTITTTLKYTKDGYEASIGTPLDYGVYHETHGRSFLARTIMEERDLIRRTIAGSKLA